VSPTEHSERYSIQVFYAKGGEEPAWTTVAVSSAPKEALYLCSEAHEMLIEALDEFRLRVRDEQEGTLLLWEDEEGALHCDEAFFDGFSES
jgi:hypothetical protein